MNYPVNFLAIILSALIPLLIRFIWFNPKVFGKAWMRASDLTDEKANSANMMLIIGFSLFFNFLIAFVLATIVVHQTGVLALFAGEPDLDNPNSPAAQELANLMKVHGDKFRSFGHGALHGTITGLFFVMPIISTNALCERRGFNYIAIYSGYWIVSLALMGGLICAWH
jgi:hypothetical protein